MMKVKAQVRWVRIGPRKLARVVDIVRGKPAVEALALLRFMPQKGARILAKVLASAVANAKNNYKLAEEGLIVAEAYVNKGITMRRWQARARGRVNPINKKTSHLTVFVSSPSGAVVKEEKAETEKKSKPKRTRKKKQEEA
ncbi:MAG: 50S ribosomal protein L22 [Candidatus Margulisiibacteriota bacterium]